MDLVLAEFAATRAGVPRPQDVDDQTLALVGRRGVRATRKAIAAATRFLEAQNHVAPRQPQPATGAAGGGA